MRVITERRKNIRNDHNASIMYSYFYANPNCFYGARMQNQSSSGVFFISNYSLDPGTVISVKEVKYRPQYTKHDIKKSDCLRVAWCKRMEDEGNFGYAIGAKRINGDFFIQTNEESNTTFPPTPSVSCEDKECQEIKTALGRIEQIAESRIRELATLHRFALATTSTLNLEKTLRIISKEMAQIFDARNAGIGILNEDKTTLKLVAFHTTKEDEIDATGMEIPIVGNAATIYVIENGQTIVVPDATKNPITNSYHDIASLRDTHCIMIVPLIVRGEVIGTIGLPTSNPDRIYNNSDVSLAHTIASQISSVIENARLYEETEKARDAAEHELEIGKEIQSGFFPDSLPKINGWEIAVHFQSARQVAGDFYDVFQLDKDRLLGFVIADVCDKGVGAALFMALFRTLIRAFSTQKYEDTDPNKPRSLKQPEEILNHTICMTNNYIANTHNSAGMFATLFFGILNPESGDLTYINCGHQAPVIIGLNEIKAQIKLTGPALGMFPDIEYKTGRIRLNPGDLLFLYTDGVTDAENPKGKFFGNERLLELLTNGHRNAEELVDTVKMNIDHHIASKDQFDDLTIVAIGRMQSLSINNFCSS